MWNKALAWHKSIMLLLAGVALGTGGAFVLSLCPCRLAHPSAARSAEPDACILRQLGIGEEQIDYRTMSDEYRHALELFYRMQGSRGGFRTGHWDEPISTDLLAEYRQTGNVGLLVVERFALGDICNGSRSAHALDVLAEIGDAKSLAVLRNIRGWGPRLEEHIFATAKKIEDRLSMPCANN